MEKLTNGTSRRVDGGSRSRSRSSSSSSDAPAATITKDKLEVGIDVDMETIRTAQLYPKRRMEKVPLIMRKDQKTRGHFDPRMVSVGPYHHGKEELQIVEKIKPIIAQLFISSSGKDMAEFRQKVLEVVDDVRSWYVEGSTDGYSDEKFVEMMLLDGLFVLAFIDYDSPSYEGPRVDEVELIDNHLGQLGAMVVLSDIMSLLENQIPFQVLELLMSLKSNRNGLVMKILNESWDNMKCKRLSLLEKISNAIRSTRSRMAEEMLNGTKKSWELTLLPIHCLEHSWLKANEFIELNDTGKHPVKHSWLEFYHSFRSISQLKAKGIHARPGRCLPSRTFRFKSFSFFAVLEIPQLILDPEYIIYLSNQIAYECTTNNPNKPTMAFINFIKSLIDNPEDVKELRSKNILFSTYSSDEEVVKMFSSIPTFDLGNDIYGDVKEMIQKHYNSKAKTWIAELTHKYFSSPWTFIALIATTSLLTLTFLQTYFTIFPRSGK